MRKDRMQVRWCHLKDELNTIEQMREDTAKRQAIARSAAFVCIRIVQDVILDL